MNTRVIVTYNPKGGVGKTSTCANLGGILAARGSKVLLIDADPSANLSVGFPDAMKIVGAPYPGLLSYAMENDFTKVLPKGATYKTIADAFPNINAHERQEKKQARKRLSIAPAQKAVFAEMPPLGRISEMITEKNVVLKAKGEKPDYMHLWRLVESVRGDFDYILIDAPGTTEGVMYLEALCAADYVLAPAEIDKWSPAALQTLRSVIKRASGLSGRKIVFLGYFLSRFVSTRTRTDVAARETIQEKDLFETVIPNSSAVKNVQLVSDVLAFAKPADDVTKCFEMLADELEEKIQIVEKGRKGKE